MEYGIRLGTRHSLDIRYGDLYSVLGVTAQPDNQAGEHDAHNDDCGYQIGCYKNGIFFIKKTLFVHDL